jgi:hypothetical protein
VDKITPLKPVAGARGAHGARPLPRPVEKASLRATELMSGYLTDMLDSADDKLFDLSEGQQTGALDAMRELRLKRAGVEAGFRQTLENQFRSAFLGDQSDDSVLGNLDLSSLSLVQEDQMEVDLAISTMARRVRMTSETQLRAFNHRLEYLSEGKKEFSERNSPLDPAQVISAFRTEAEKLDVDIRTRLIMFKLFERLVLSELGFVITEVNQTLIDSGVLADMTTPPIRATRKPGERAPKPAEAAAPGNPVEALLGAQGGAAGGTTDPSALYAMFGELLDAVRQISVRPGAAPTPSNMAVMQGGVAYVNGAPVTDPAQVRPVSSDDLVGMLNRLQRVESSIEELGQDHVPVRAEDMDVRVELSSLLGAEGGEEAVHALDQADDAVINLVSMLFDFIFDDQALATEIKALIGRLQIPFLKAAIADKSFFSNEQHPARQFLNTLARAGSQWSSAQGVSDPLYRLIRETVFKVLNDFELDARFFERLTGEVEDVVGRQESQRQRVEERLQEVEQGKVLAEQTRRIVTVALQERIGQRALPSVAASLIKDAWQQVLYLTCLREGSGSEAWQRHLKVLEVLVWSVLPKKDDAARAKLTELAPKLQVSLRKGLEAIGFDGAERQRLLDELAALHTSMLETTAEVTPPVEVVVLEPEPEPVAEVAEEEELPIDHPTLKKVTTMKSGQWIEIGEGETSKRLRLAANVRHGTKLVFINARGIREAEYSGMALALAVEAGEIRLIDGSPLFDRALESVIGDLRRIRQQSAPA